MPLTRPPNHHVGVLVCMLAGSLTLFQSSPAAAQSEGAPGARICLAPTTVEAAPGGFDPETAVRETFTSFLTGPSLSLVPLEARLVSQAREEARLSGCGFLLLVWGAQFAGEDFKVGIWWLAGLYLIHSAAELCISPVGLSMITKLSIARIVGMMMGVWFLSISVAQYVAGVVAQFASVETVGGQVTNLKVSLETYTGVFWTIGLTSIVVGVILFALAPLIKRWMHGVT